MKKKQPEISEEEKTLIYYANLLDYKLENPQQGQKAYALSKIFDWSPQDDKIRTIEINGVEFCTYKIDGDILILNMTVLSIHDAIIQEDVIHFLIRMLHGKTFGVVKRVTNF